MAELTAPEVNGHIYDFTSIRFEANGVKMPSITKIAYSDSVERGEFRGTSPYVRATTRGKYSAEGSASMSRLQFEAFETSFGDGIYDAIFTGTVSYADTGQPTVTDTLEGVQIKKRGLDNSEGGDPATIDLDLFVVKVKFNGREPFPIVNV